MGPNLQIDRVIVQQLLQSEDVQEREADPGQSLVMRAVVVVQVAAVHRTVAHDDDPWALRSIFGEIRGQEVVLQPLVLEHHGFYSVIHEVVYFCRDGNEMDGTYVYAVHETLRTAGHAETFSVVAEIAGKRNYIIFKSKKANQNM